jgi:hypothetical protein
VKDKCNKNNNMEVFLTKKPGISRIRRKNAIFRECGTQKKAQQAVPFLLRPFRALFCQVAAIGLAAYPDRFRAFGACRASREPLLQKGELPLRSRKKKLKLRKKPFHLKNACHSSTSWRRHAPESAASTPFQLYGLRLVASSD